MVMDKNTAKELIKKGVELGDDSLIEMGRQILEDLKKSELTLTETEKTTIINKRTDVDDFRMQVIDPSKSDSNRNIAKKQKIGNLRNEFEDDLTEAKEDLISSIISKAKEEGRSGKLYGQIKQRARKNPLVKIRCVGCLSEFDVNPIHLRTDETGEKYYMCDRCIQRKGSGRG